MEDRISVIVAGSRSIEEYDKTQHAIERTFEHAVEQSLAADVLEVVSGTADGPDSHGETWASRRGVPVERFPADWDEHGKAAGPIRNQQMAEYADVLVAVWDGESSGTENMIDTALQEGLEVHVYQHRGLARYE